MNAPPPELWRRIEPILEQALELEPESQSAYLDERCAGDERLRQEIELLLVADREAADFLSGAVGDVAGSVLRRLDPAPPAPAGLAAGDDVGRYRIVGRLGAGGMGEVYEALDPELGRTVALKLLPSDWAADPERPRRFEREAKALAALDHPSIVTIFSVELSHGTPFFTMELVRGRTLEELIPTGGMALEKFLDLAVPLADALRAAHEKGLAHRDLKPANVMVTEDGRLKILDFGLVKLDARTAGASVTASTAMTQEGNVVGTLPYMSPEQAQGQSVDLRTDTFSLGVLLYEMIAGRRPFQGETPAVHLAALLRDAPRPVTDLRADVPASVGELIRKCLEKEPGRRPSSAEVRDRLDRLRHRIEAERFLADSGTAAPSRARRGTGLRWATAGAVLVTMLGLAYWQMKTRSEPVPAPAVSSPEEPAARERERTRVVVLPFEHLGRPEDRYFSVGVSEEIRSRLAVVGDLAVISGTSSRAYTRTDKTIAQIGEELGVEYVLEGAVRWERIAGGKDRIRITPELIRTADDTSLWADVYEQDLAGILAVQSEIAARVVEELGTALLTEEREAMDARPTENLEAYQAYLRGRAFLGQVQDIALSLPVAAESFERAVALDPGFALAYAELSRIHSQSFRGTMDRAEAEAARRSLEQATELAPGLPEVQLAQAYYAYQVTTDYDQALRILSRLESRRPNDAEALEARSYILRHQGRWEESLRVAQRAAELNPRNLWLLGRLACFTLMPLERYSEAMEVINRTITLGPDQRALYDAKAFLYWSWKGDTEQARTVLQAVPAVGPFSQMMQYYQELFEGRYDAALEQVSAMSGPWVEGSALGRWPKALLQARVYELMSSLREREEDPRWSALARDAYETALDLAAEELLQKPDGPEVYSALGYAYAGLDRRKEAVEAGKRAVELRPIHRYAGEGPRYVKHLAAIYTRVGDYEAALDELERLLSLPTEQLSVPLMELEPWWEPLRDHPRYSMLVKKYRLEE